MTLRITKNAYEIIKEESLRCETETGGLLIGTLQVPIVIRATKAGDLAKKNYVSYTNDKNYDSRILEKTIQEFNGKVKNIGRWHKHPDNMFYPSSGDLATARNIAKRSEQEGDKRPVFFMITNVIKGTVKLYCYVLNNNKTFVKVGIEVIENNAQEVEETLRAEPVIIQPKEMDFWHDSDFQFYLTKNGYERLKFEYEELVSNGYGVKVYAKKKVYMVIEKVNEKILCLPPPEYPLNPPRFFRDGVEIEYSMRIWNSTFRILDILEYLNNLKNQEGRANESHSHKTGFNVSGFVRQVKRAIKSLWSHKA